MGLVGLALWVPLVLAAFVRVRPHSSPVIQIPPAEQNPPHVQRLLDAKCTRCHAGADAALGLRVDTWKNLFKGSAHGEAIIPYDAANSLLIEITTKLVGGPHPGELSADTLTRAEVDTLTRWINAGAPSDLGEVPFENAVQRLYVCNQDDAIVSVIDMETNLVVRTIELQELGFSPNAKPHHTAVDPDGSFWYVSLIGDNWVLKFNRENELVGQVQFERPGMLSLHQTEDLLFVGRSMAAVNPPQRIGVIKRSDMTIDEIDVFFPRPHALQVSADGRHVYAASLAVNQIASVNRETEELELTTLEGQGPPHVLVQFALSPDGGTLVAGGQLTGKLLIFDASAPPTLTLIDAIDVNPAPWHPVFTPDGRFVYVGNNEANTVTVIDMENRSVAAVIEGRGIAEPHGIAVSADGRYVYVSNRNLKGGYTPRYDLGDNERTGTVVVINTATRAIEKVIEIGRYPAGMSTRATN